MMTEQDIKDIYQWLLHPYMFKHKLKEKIESGVAFQFLEDQSIDEIARNSLRTMIPHLIKSADFKKLFKVYQQKLVALYPSQVNMGIWEKDFVRVLPSKRKL